MPRKRQGLDEEKGEGGVILDVPFHEAARRRYLNYALSVITSRALPDVRDGLKPVQRRILYTMHHDLRLHPNAKPIKCAGVVGDVLGRYHPHGDTAVYDALVRMAQSWSLRYPLIEGHGNFGSMDGDPPAAYRYTEARLRPITSELLDDLGKETVEFRDNYDGNHREPCVLPARLPQLLINGTTGIAVGMATSIPPHNLREVADACVALIENRNITTAGLMKHLKGPDFPVGGLILNSRSDLRKIYEEGQGSIRMRGEYAVEGGNRGTPRIIIKSIPYLTETDKLVQRIAELIVSRKVPQMIDVRNESTEKDGLRIVIELRRDSNPDLVMAYLYKNTPLQSTFGFNLNCLVPAGRSAEIPSRGRRNQEEFGEVALAPNRLNLKSMLLHFIDFRFEVVERRFRHELRLLRERIHVLEGFRKIFDALDEAVRIIRKSDGKKEAAEKLMKRYKLDAVQADAILELKLYRLARLEIQAILDELREKRRSAREIEGILDSKRRIWSVVKQEIKAAGEKFSDSRRTRIGGHGEVEAEYDEEAFIADEDATVLLSRDGWVRRVQRVTDLSKVRLRQDDELLSIVGGNTRSSVIFFSNFGVAYTVRINDIPPSPRGFGDPVQRLFKYRDGERTIAAVSLDPRALGGDPAVIGKPNDKPGTIPKLHALAISSSGYGIRFGLLPFAEASTRAGRRFARVREGEEITEVMLVSGGEVVVTATRGGRALLCKVDEINFLGGPGRGVQVLKVAKNDRVLGFMVSRSESDGLTVVRDNGKKIPIRPRNYRITSRAGKGFEVIKRGRLDRIQRNAAALPEYLKPAGPANGNGNSNGRNGSETEREE